MKFVISSSQFLKISEIIRIVVSLNSLFEWPRLSWHDLNIYFNDNSSTSNCDLKHSTIISHEKVAIFVFLFLNLLSISGSNVSCLSFLKILMIIFKVISLKLGLLCCIFSNKIPLT